MSPEPNLSDPVWRDTWHGSSQIYCVCVCVCVCVSVVCVYENAIYSSALPWIYEILLSLAIFINFCLFFQSFLFALFSFDCYFFNLSTT
jgi:hypothetical protein